MDVGGETQNVVIGNVTPSTANETYIPYQQRPETYIVPVVFALIFVVGVLGNGTLVVIFARHRNLRNVPNTYIFSLALGDLLVIVSCVPFTSTVYTVESWPYGELICKLSEGVKDVSIGVSVFTLTALSADRFFAIVDPMGKLHVVGGGKGATRFTILVAVSIWVIAILCAMPAAVTSYIKVFQVNPDTSFQVCYPFPDDWGMGYARAVIISKFFVYYALPLAIIAVFYILMARHLVLSTQNLPGEPHGSMRQVRARKKVAKTVLAFVVVFAVCFFPQHVFMLWFYTDPSAAANYNGFWHAFRIIGFCLSFINSCVNPIALYCVSGAFRKHFNRYLLCCCKGRRDPPRSDTQLRHTTSRRRPTSTWDSGGRSTVRRHEVTTTTFMNGIEKI